MDKVLIIVGVREVSSMKKVILKLLISSFILNLTVVVSYV